MNDFPSPSAQPQTAKRVLGTSLLYYGHLAASILFGVVLIYLALYYTLILPFYGGFTDDAVWNRLRVSVFTVGFSLVSAVWLFVVFRRRAYRAGAFSLRATLLPAALSVVIHAVLSALLRGTLFISGAPYFAAWLISSGGAPLEDGARVPLGLILLLLLLFDALFVGVILLASYLGARQRQRQRQDIVGPH